MSGKDQKDFVIEHVSEKRHLEFLDLVYQEFFPREVLAIASGLGTKTNPGTIQRFTEWLHQNYSIAVVDPKTDRIVAVVLNCLVDKGQSVIDHSALAPEDQVIWNFLDGLDAGYDIFENLKVDNGLELVFLCVHPDYIGKGLARLLTEETISLARSRGVPFIKSNPTTPATCHLFESLGFETVNEKRLVAHLLENGQPGFPYAKPEHVVRLTVKKL